MHKPLSLNPQRQRATNTQQDSKSSSIFKYADSLAFSLTEDKNISNKSSFFGEEKHQKVSKQLQSLQIKLEDLQTQIIPITLQSCKSSSNNNKTIKYNCKFDHNTTANYFRQKKLLSQGKENVLSGLNGAGKIVRKRNEEGKMVKANKGNKVDNQINNSKNSLITDTSEIQQRQKLAIKLKKELENVRNQLSKSQKSVSICSERLSASKSLIKNMKIEQKKYQKNIQKLKHELKKSQSIREKQKKVILSQRLELQKCRQVLKKINKN